VSSAIKDFGFSDHPITPIIGSPDLLIPGVSDVPVPR